MALKLRSPASTGSIEPAPPPATDPQHTLMLQMLEQSPWANDLEERQLSLFARYMRVMYADAGVHIFTEGEREHFLCLVVDGKVDILKEDSTGARHVVITLNRGKTIGELSLLDGGPRSSTAVARENSILLVLDEDAFDDLEDAQPALAARILRVLARLLSQRLRMTSGRLVDHLEDVVERTDPGKRGWPGDPGNSHER
jgi:CRP/FNR family cyclic AMP-dependent transcriptional regulator